MLPETDLFQYLDVIIKLIKSESIEKLCCEN